MESSTPSLDKASRLISLKAAAKRLGRRYIFLRELVRAGKVTAYQVGRHVLVDPETIGQEFLNATRIKPVDPTYKPDPLLSREQPRASRTRRLPGKELDPLVKC